MFTVIAEPFCVPASRFRVSAAVNCSKSCKTMLLTITVSSSQGKNHFLVSLRFQLGSSRLKEKPPLQVSAS
jgi:hypothetical protein